MRTELYFLSSQKNRPSLFGMPLIVPCTVHTSKKDLYDAVWIQVSRLASPLPPQEASNHAQDWSVVRICQHVCMLNISYLRCCKIWCPLAVMTAWAISTPLLYEWCRKMGILVPGVRGTGTMVKFSSCVLMCAYLTLHLGFCD